MNRTRCSSLKTTRARLKAAADPKFEAGLRWFFKEPVKPYGVRTPLVRELARLAYRGSEAVARGRARPVRYRIVEERHAGGRRAGEPPLPAIREIVRRARVRMFEQWINRYVRNWSHCDGVSTWLIAASIANRPGLADRLAGWTKSKNRWKRRSAAVSLIQEAKRGRNTETIFHICGLLLDDADDMVQKGVGWLLKETYPKKPREVLDFLDLESASAPAGAASRGREND